MAITLPSDARKFRVAVTPLFVFVFAIAVAGLCCYVFAKDGWHFNRHALAFAIGFQAIVAFVLSWTVSFCCRDALSSDGIYGHSFWGQRRFVCWRDVTDARTLRIFNLRCLRVYAVDGKVTWLALFQSRDTEFRQEIRRLAPSENPILKCL